MNCFSKLAALVLSALFLLSCGSEPSRQVSDSSSIPAVESVSYGTPTAVSITNPHFFDGKDSVYKTEWLNTFASQYGIEIAVTVPSGDAIKDGYSSYLSQAALDGALSGLVYVENHQQLLLLMNLGLLDPIDAIVNSNHNYTLLPENFTKAFSKQSNLGAPRFCRIQIGRAHV